MQYGVARKYNNSLIYERLLFYFPFSFRSLLTISFANHNIPSDALIEGVQIKLTSATNGNKTATIGKLYNENISGNDIGWASFNNENNTNYFTNIPYNSDVINVSSGSALWNNVVAAVGSGSSMKIFVRANDESPGMNATVSAIIYVLWRPAVSVTVQNSFVDVNQNPLPDPGGKINIDYNEYTTSSKTVSWGVASPHILVGWNQTIGNLVYPFLMWTRTVGSYTDELPGNSISVSPTTNTTYTANYGPGQVATTIDQKLSTDVSAGNIGIWNGGSFPDYSAPVVKPFLPSSNQVLRGTQGIVSGEKYNYWKIRTEIQSDVVNHHSFSISTSNNSFTSQLKPTVDGTSFQVKILETGATYTDNIFFKDPWLVDYPDSYGTRNQGMTAPFKTVATGGNPLGITTSYKGVLKDQLLTNGFYYSVQAPSLKTLGGISSGFINWSTNSTATVTDPLNTTSPIVFSGASAVVTANYHGVHLTNSTSALANTSQRKIVRTDEGYLFLVYESLNRVWLERSVDEGATWTLCNNGPIDNGPEAKSPSIDYLTEVYFGGVDNELYITYQQKTSNGNYTIQIARCNNEGQKLSSQLIYTSPSSYSNNATPIISVTWFVRTYPEWRKQIVGIWKEPASSGVNAGLYWYGAFYIGSTFYWNNAVTYYEQIGTTNSSSVNPSIDIFKYDSDARTSALNFHFAWEQAGQSINYWQVICGYSGLSLSGFVSTPSYGDGCPNNYRPSITAVTNTGARLSWQGYYNDGTDMFSSTIFADPGYPNHFWNFGSNVTSTNISKNYDVVYGTLSYAIGWTQFNGSAYSNYAVKNTTLSGPINLNTAGKDMQLHNSWNFTDQRGVSLTTSSPYAFQLSTPIEQSGGGGGKEFDKNSSTQISAGRMGVVTSGNAQFHFTLGDISVNGVSVDFKELTDTSKIISSADYKSFLITKPFALDENSQFFYGVQYGVTDSAEAVSVLGDNKIVHFTVELIDAATEQVIGVTDDVTYSAANVTPYENIAYEVNTNGIGNKTVKLRLSVSTTLSANYTLADKRAQSSILAKQGSQRVQKDYSGSLVVKEYALSQNFPNPFNPTTTINYALPKTGNVVLKVYDILGKEVATLVNDYKELGRYQVEFDASKLSSGMYIYKLTSDKFTEVKKMLLLR